MPYNFPNNNVDLNRFLVDLMRDIGCENADPKKKEKLEAVLKNQLNDMVLRQAAMHLEPAVIEEISEYYSDEDDPIYLIGQLIRYSPEAQWAILDAIDAFYDQTVDAYKTFTKQH